jgi:peptide/nickel transport system substrate-binding protein
MGGFESRHDRRTFLARGLGGAAALALAGTGASALSSCGSNTSSSAAQTSRKNAGVGSGTPRRGGTITVGMNSEIDGFSPASDHFDNTGLTYARTVFDSLTIIAPDGSARPYLAQSVTPNADMTVWTLTLRPGVTFHDGSPLNADVVVANANAVRSSPLTAQAVRPITGVKSLSDLEVQFVADQPLVAFPHYLATQIGYMAALSQLDNPNASQKPVGTGPFKYVSWEPNDHFTVERNPAYWRNGIPYLDGITFKPIIQDMSRESSLRSGTIDLMVSHDPNAIAALRDDQSFQQVDDLTQTAGQPDMDFICLNTTAAPLDDLVVRQAIAYATDAQTLTRLFGAGVTPATSSLYPEGSPYRPAHNGYPSYDLAKAKSLVAQAAASHGGKIKFTLGDIPDPRQTEIIQALQSMWGQAGMEVSLTQVQQVTYIDNLVTGQFQAYADEQFSASDPDINYVWLSDTTASGPIALNFARNKDPQIEAALIQGRTHAEPAARIEAYQTVDKLLARDLPYIWTSRAPWSVTASNKVVNFAGPTFPDGSHAEGFRAGVFTPTEIWLQG